MATKADARTERVTIKRQHRATPANMKLRGEGAVTDPYANSVPNERPGLNVSTKEHADAVGGVFGGRTRR